MLHLLGRLILAGVIVAVVVAFGSLPRRGTSERSLGGREPAAEKRPAAAPPILDGWTYAEVVRAHGEPGARDKASGWASWPAFRAHFARGVVDDVQGARP